MTLSLNVKHVKLFKNVQINTNLIITVQGSAAYVAESHISFKSGLKHSLKS